MADLTDTIKLLERQRDELLDQVNAIIRAIAALKGTDGSARRLEAPYARQAPLAAPRAPEKARKKRHFVLSEEHKKKLLEGQRRARETRMAAATANDTGAVPPAGWAGDGAPRLVRREPTA
jgi:ABC-type hemin transport system substrate-binding protein